MSADKKDEQLTIISFLYIFYIHISYGVGA